MLHFVEEVRSVRAEMNVPGGMKINLQILQIHPNESRFLQENELVIKQMARILEIEFDKKMRDGSISISVPGADFCLPLANLIDISSEKGRLEKSLAKLELEHDMLDTKVQNKKFLLHAPTEVTENIRLRLSTLAIEINKKKVALSRLTELS